MTILRTLLILAALLIGLAGCGGSDPAGPIVFTACETSGPVTVTCAPSPGPTATATATGTPATATAERPRR
jgi:ABC-type glycerol-3-phosphate transport system substrate-binding protein